MEQYQAIGVRDLKLILCKKCSDVVRLIESQRSCRCGESFGSYLDEIRAEVGGPCLVLGFSNQSLSRAARDQISLGDRDEEMGFPYAGQKKGRDFEAFIVPDSASSVIRKESD